MGMYRLMIADDEDEERVGIRFLLKKYGFQFEITEAVDGKDALKKLEEKGADILFTDVKMPFLNGLELSEYARKLMPGIQIIFFSGYDDFDYVKQALSLQAVDYILKPVSPIEFQKVIALVLERMEKENAKKQQNQQFQRTFMLTRLFNQVPLEKLEKKYGKQELGFLGEYERIILLEFEEEFFGKAVADIRELDDKIRKAMCCPYDLLDMNPFQGIVLLKKVRGKAVDCMATARDIQQLIEREYRSRCYLSVGPELSHPGTIGLAYSEAESYLEDRFFYKDEFVYPIGEDRKKRKAGTEDAGQFLQAIENDVNFRDVAGLRRDAEILLGICRNNGFQSYIYTRFICANLLKLLYQGLPGEEEQLTENVEKLYACTRFSEIETMVESVLDKLEQALLAGQDSPRHVTALVEQYIYEHYMDTLSLDILAEKVYLTPHYLSSIFSQEKKIGISKYIKNIRMEKAEELLRNTNMKVQDICKAVGYSNLSYFCKTFRNEFGVTPEKYREK